MARSKKSDGILKRMGQLLVYGLFLMVELLLRLTPLRVCVWLGRKAGWLAWIFLGSYRRLAENNIRIAFGREKSEVWIRQTARRHFVCLGGNVVCGLKLPLMSQEAVESRVTTEGMEHVKALVDAGKPVLFAVCHLSCWELLTQVPALFTFGRPPASVFQSLGNPFLNRHLKRRREKLGYTLFDRADGFSGPMKHLRERKGAIGVLVDQHAGDKGVWCPFFDRLASTSNLIGLMSIRCETPILPLAVYDEGPGRWRLVCSPPVDSREVIPTADGLAAAMNVAVEQMVRRLPHNWFWVHNRWKTPNPHFLLSQYKRGIVYPAGYKAENLQPFNVLVRSPNWLGDACMTFPAVRALKRGRPDVRVTVLTPSKLTDLWCEMPEVDAVIRKGGHESIGVVAKRIRKKGFFDVAVLFTNSTRSTLELKRAGIPRLVGYRGSLRSRWLDQIIPEDKKGEGRPLHHSERYLRIAHCCGADLKRNDLQAPVRRRPSGALLGICAGAEYGEAKRWPAERFTAVAANLSRRWPRIEWLIFGAPGEQALGEKISSLLGATKHRNLVGKTSLKELVELLQECHVLVTNDTGTMHLAAAFGVPTVSIFGSTEPRLTGPLGNIHAVVRRHVSCSPCFKRECPFGHYDCMTGVTVERVERTVVQLLARNRQRGA